MEPLLCPLKFGPALGIPEMECWKGKCAWWQDFGNDTGACALLALAKSLSYLTENGIRVEKGY